MLLIFLKKIYDPFAIAFSFLTRLPVPGLASISFSQKNLSRSLTFYPLVGLFFGIVCVAIARAGIALHVDTFLIAFVVLCVPFALNRFLHFDGFCDVMDAFLADKTPEQRLEIMKDSRNGSFALGAAILLVLGKFLLIFSLLSHGLGALLIFAPLLARWIMVPMSFRAVYPRPVGTGLAIVGQVSLVILFCATLVLLVALEAGMVLSARFSARGLALSVSVGIGVSLLWMIALRAISRTAIGGVTGDVLGFLSETTELVFFIGAGVPLMIGANWY